MIKAQRFTFPTVPVDTDHILPEDEEETHSRRHPAQRLIKVCKYSGRELFASILQVILESRSLLEESFADLTKSGDTKLIISIFGAEPSSCMYFLASILPFIRFDIFDESEDNTAGNLRVIDWTPGGPCKLYESCAIPRVYMINSDDTAPQWKDETRQPDIVFAKVRGAVEGVDSAMYNLYAGESNSFVWAKITGSDKSADYVDFIENHNSHKKETPYPHPYLSEYLCECFDCAMFAKLLEIFVRWSIPDGDFNREFVEILLTDVIDNTPEDII